MPNAFGAPVKPTYSRWRSRPCTAGVHGPALRRTVWPTRTTVLVLPPCSGISCCVKNGPSREPRVPRGYAAAPNPARSAAPRSVEPQVGALTGGYRRCSLRLSQQRVDELLGVERG